MSLSPIFSIINDFLVVVRGAVSEFGESMLRDMCKDLGVTFLFPPTRVFLLLGKDEPLTFFMEDCDADSELEVDAGFENFREEIWGRLVIGGSGFFFAIAKSLTLLIGEI
jgi:hypothetical protein